MHHPPCQSYKVNQEYYWCGQIAQLLLLQHQVLPEKAWQHGPVPLIRHFVRSVGQLQNRGRGRKLLFGRCNYRLGWLLLAGRIGPGWGAAGAAGTEPEVARGADGVVGGERCA